MKSFSQFLSEAVKTTASTQAKQKGLVGDGHGGWYDKKGKFVAKTVGGKLKFTSSKEAATDDAPKQGGPAKPNVPGKTKTSSSAPSSQSAKSKGESETDVAKTPEPGDSAKQSAELMGAPASEGAVIVFGRFNPPTTGHEKLLKFAGNEAKRKGFDLRVYPSRTADAKKNPLQPGTKIEYMKKMFPDYEESIKDDPNAKTIFDVLTVCFDLGYRAVSIVVGQDRLAEFQSLAQKYNGDLYEFEEITVISAGSRDADSEGLEGMSASKMRKSAADNDFKSFAKGIPTLGNVEKKQLFNTLQKSMGISVSETWEIAPELDLEGLRMAYIDNEVFSIGALVENVNTGEIGRITRKGTNYVICMTSEGHMFKAWLKDIAEAYEVGTDEYREYTQSMTPGQYIKKFGQPKNRIDPTILPSKPNDPPKGPGLKYNK
jgi:hypothetical protein